jgi:phage tail-like protein
MDSNGTQFLLLAEAADFANAQAELAWDVRTGSFGLVQRQPLRLPRVPAAAAAIAWAAAEPLVLDDHGQVGRLSDDHRRFLFAPAWPPTEWHPVLSGAEGLSAVDAESLSLTAVEAPAGTVFTDLHLGGDALAALTYSDAAADHGLVVVHLRLRWCARCTLPEAPVRVWADGADRVWALGRTSLMQCEGRPLPQPYRPQPDRFEPLAPNPDPLRLVCRHPLPDTDQVLALAADSDRVYVLARRDDPEGDAPRQVVLTLSLEASLGTEAGLYPVDAEAPFATDLAVVDGGRLALLAPREPADADFRNRDCPVVALDEDPEPRGRLIYERYPQSSQAAVRFVRALDGKTRYLAADRPRELHRLAQARFPREASAVLSPRLDSGQPDTLWHRLTLDACIPAGCTLRIDARVTDDWDARAAAGWDAQRPPAWLPVPSELPWDGGRLAPEPGHQGLFEVLLQRPNGAVRELRGRYLQLRLTLTGDGRHTPRIHAIRAWFPRFSWQQAFLPDHFHQQERPPTVTPDPETAPEPANGADVRERLLAAFADLLTPIEDRIAAAEVLLDPLAAPAGRLPVLARMLGARPQAQWPEPRRRAWLADLGRIQRARGTRAGLARALDIATDGLVRLGEVVVVENYRLRRTLATILGIDMSDEGHPLTLGTGRSGNSIVGESLILTDEDARELLALFAPELAETGADRAAVDAFFDRYARRLTVVLHGEARQRRRTVEEVLAREVPAAVQWMIRETDHPFILGLSPLLGIDSFLEHQPPFGRVVLNETRIGRGDLLRNAAALSPEYVSAGGSVS